MKRKRELTLTAVDMPTYKTAQKKTSPLPAGANVNNRFRLVFVPTYDVTFGLNVRLDLSGEATTKSLSSLCAELLLKILGESTWTVAVWVIRGDEGVGDIPGVRGGSGESSSSAQDRSIDTRTQT